MTKIPTQFGKKSFWNKIRFKYKLSFLNEKTLEEAWSLRLSLLSAILLSLGLFVTVLLVVSTLIVKTPLKNFLPGYLDINMRQDIVRNALKVDSLERHIERQGVYISGLKEIISGNIKADTIVSTDTLAVIIDKKELEKSAEELAFAQKFAEEEKYSLTNVAETNVAKSMKFFVPCKGKWGTKFGDESFRTGVSIQVEPAAPVSTIYDGTVVYCGLTVDQRYVVQVQHPNDFISTYRNLNSLSTAQGKRIKTGDVVGIASKEKGGSTIWFEIWNNGRAVNPENYIQF